ncbi:MAG: 5-(carboxyamino)imidazole ribonucleotide synthase [Dehalococcoidia bacterium]|nr:5-(carboxyamino)imidazole ribonucleotide synthase [Dehalococcoidia bacterium]
MVGGGQLARMTYQAAIPLGVTLRVLSERADDGAALVSADVEIGSHTDLEALRRFAAGCDVVTFDHELAPPELLEKLAGEGHVLRPSPAAMRFAQDKLWQREQFGALGLPVPAHAVVATAEDVAAFATDHGGWPVVIKAARGGYDGRGVWVARSPEDAARVVAEGSAGGLRLFAEAMVELEREVAVLIARRPGGESVVYPVVETVQADGMCRELVSPAPIDPSVAAHARNIAERIADGIGVTGIMAVELFVAKGGDVLVNEIATRPHNSGHHTIEGCVTSQFENHVRAVLDWPLGSTAPAAPAVVTVNVVGGASGGDPRANLPRALAVPGVHVHLYGKGPRPGRKLGHVTALGEDVSEVRERADRAAAILVGEPA